MIIKLDGSRKKADGKGFDRKDVKAMVQEYRAPQTPIDPLLYSHFSVYEILDLCIKNGILKDGLADEIQNQEKYLKGYGIKIYLGSTLRLTELDRGPEYNNKATTILCNTVIGHGLRDKLDDYISVAAGKTDPIEEGQGLDQAEICPPYHADNDDDYDIGL